jgi:hypothetical protein
MTKSRKIGILVVWIWLFWVVFGLEMMKLGTVKSSSCAPWMKIVLREKKTFTDRMGKRIHESNPLFNAKIELYHKSTTNNNNYNSSTSWCASFVSWCLNEVNIENPQSTSSQAFIGHKYLKKIEKPAYGAIAIFRDFLYLGDNKDEDFREDNKLVFFKNEVEYVEKYGFVTSIKKNEKVIFQKNDKGHINFVISLVKGKEKSLVNCIGGNQDGGYISQNTYIYTKDQLFFAYGNTYRMFMGFYIPKNATICSHVGEDKANTFSSLD